MKILAKERPLTPSWDLLSTSIDLLKKHTTQVIFLSALPSLLWTLGSLWAPKNWWLQSWWTMSLTHREIIGISISFVAFIWGTLVYPGFLLFAARAAQGKEMTTSKAIKKALPRLLPLIIVEIVMFVLIFVGLLLLLVPGLIAIRSLVLAPYYVVEKKLGPWAALKQSAENSKPVSGWIWGTIGVIFALFVASVMLDIIPVAGLIAGFIISFLYIFGPALRYCEVVNYPIVKPAEPDERL